MRQVGKVVGVSDGVAIIRFVRSAACKNCGACLYVGEKEAETEVKNTLNAKEGDAVSVELHAKSFLEASFLAYVFPLMMLLIGLFIGIRISDVMGAILALVFAAGSYFVLRALEPRFAKSMRYRPRMVEFSTEEEENICGGNNNGR